VVRGSVDGVPSLRTAGLELEKKGEGEEGIKLDVDEVRQPTKTESRGQYRGREDQYLCIEIQPEVGDDRSYERDGRFKAGKEGGAGGGGGGVYGRGGGRIYETAGLELERKG